MNILLDTADPGSSVLPQLLLILFLTILNAFFAASELAILSANKNKMELLAEQGNKKARLVMKLSENQTNFLSTIQVGITLAGFFSSATAATALSAGFARFLQSIGLPYMEEVSMVLITLFLSYITLVFGELFPKRIALNFPEKVSLLVAPVINILTKVAYPFVKLLSGSCNLLVFLTRIEKNVQKEKMSEDEIKTILKTGEEEGAISGDSARYINRVFDFDDLKVQEIMTPRINVFAVDVNWSIEELIAKIKEEKYTRMPVYDNEIDNVIGILNLKDLIFSSKDLSLADIDIKNIIRKPILVTKHTPVTRVFKIFKQTKNQMAIVVDEFGGFSGLITLEDIQEELIGDIDDEHDDEVEYIKIDDRTYKTSGLMNIVDVNRLLGINLEDKEESFNTLNGFMIEHLGRIPEEVGLEVEYKGFTFKVLSIVNNHINEILITKNE